MSVKIFCEDAKHLVEQKIQEWKILTERFERHTDYHATAELNKAVRFLEAMLVEKPNLWTRTGPVDAKVFEPFSKKIAFLHPDDSPMYTEDSVLSLGTLKSIFSVEVKGTIVVCYNAFFAVNGLYSNEEAELLVANKVRKLRGEVDYLKFRKGVSASASDYERLPIPEDVRNEVWRRDQGKCVRCGSVRNLEFDHIIPVAKGGSNTARNIQLLCETCNRQKSANIG